MTVGSSAQLLQAGLAHHQAGRLGEAERAYRQILSQEPNNHQAIHLLGMLAGQIGRHDDAIALVSRAVALDPTAAFYHSNLGNVYKAAGKLEPAIAAYQKSVALAPGMAEAHSNLGLALKEVGRHAEAKAACEKALQLKPTLVQAMNNLAAVLLAMGQHEQAWAMANKSLQVQPNPSAYNNLGTALASLGRPDEALRAFDQSLRLQPNNPQSLQNAGLAAMAMGQLPRAIDAFERAIALAPQQADAHVNLSRAFERAGDYDRALAAAHGALRVNPQSAAAHNQLAVALARKGFFRDATAEYRQAISLDPNHAATHYNLGNCLREQGMLTEAVASIKRAIELEPGNPVTHACWLYIMQFVPGHDAAAIRREHAAWSARHAAPLKSQVRPHDNDRSPDRRLRVGYVSPDFGAHVVGRNMLPLFMHRDRTQFEVHCFASVDRPDAVTQRYRQLADQWHDVAALSDAQLAEFIRAQKIDILVDWTLHMTNNRMLTFARKPAPVQITMAGYPGSTGLEAMDYRITDRHLDPAGTDEYYVEKSLRMPHSFWCYDPKCMSFGLAEAPEPGPLPAIAAGHVTFGCLNSFSKINDGVYALWEKVLAAVPESRLMMLAPPGPHLETIRERFAKAGIAPERIRFTEFLSFRKYLEAYQSIDIALDTIPYNGHTTSLDGLYMGVPVVTLVGDTVVGRAGVSQLTNLGLPELITRTPEEYVRVAAELAGNRERLAALRATLRGRMQQSPLADGIGFARAIENFYRQAWRTWCGVK